MSAFSSWFDDLEASLNQQWEALLGTQAQQGSRQDLLREAESLRHELLALVQEIKEWQGRVRRAQSAHQPELAARAQKQVNRLMAQGRARWDRLGAIGQVLLQQPAASGSIWDQLETEQALEDLRRKLNL